MMMRFKQCPGCGSLLRTGSWLALIHGAAAVGKHINLQSAASASAHSKLVSMCRLLQFHTYINTCNIRKIFTVIVMLYYTQYGTRYSLSLLPGLTAIFPGGTRFAGTRIFHSGLNRTKDDGGGSHNWSYKMCKAPPKSSSPTNQYQAFYTQ